MSESFSELVRKARIIDALEIALTDGEMLKLMRTPEQLVWTRFRGMSRLDDTILEGLENVLTGYLALSANAEQPTEPQPSEERQNKERT